MRLRDLASKSPEHADYFERLDSAFEACRGALRHGHNLPAEERQIAATNAIFRFYVEIGAANDLIAIGGFTEGEALADLASRCRRDPQFFELGLTRAIKVAVFYEARVRHPDCGPSDSPIEAAMQAVAIREGLSPDNGAETVRKSIQRYRRGLRGQRLGKFDPKTGTINLVDAEERMPKGLPGKPGRPRKRA